MGTRNQPSSISEAVSSSPAIELDAMEYVVALMIFFLFPRVALLHGGFPNMYDSQVAIRNN